MSIYTSMNRLIEKLDHSMFVSGQVPDPSKIVRSMREVMPEIWRYGKNINPQSWEWLKPYIDSDEEIAISESMYKDAERSWARLK